MSIHRMEIVSGTGRRRSWSTALKEQLVSETLEPGVTVTEVARRHDLDPSLIYRAGVAPFGGDALVRPALLPVEVVDYAAAGTESSLPRMTRAPRRVRGGSRSSSLMVISRGSIIRSPARSCRRTTSTRSWPPLETAPLAPGISFESKAPIAWHPPACVFPFLKQARHP
ncbi:MAG: transposase [Mesorhizobium sp.]|nr:MAG: transposase [Mesorhizobium sp.]RWC40750.1 MAG: transposase [Mesorhizobium sp.]RWF76652.1 MAG: transposase [Mesorhizobium sp.]